VALATVAVRVQSPLGPIRIDYGLTMKETTASTLALEKGSKMQQTVAKSLYSVRCRTYRLRSPSASATSGGGNWALLCAGGYALTADSPSTG